MLAGSFLHHRELLLSGMGACQKIYMGDTNFSGNYAGFESIGQKRKNWNGAVALYQARTKGRRDHEHGAPIFRHGGGALGSGSDVCESVEEQNLRRASEKPSAESPTINPSWLLPPATPQDPPDRVSAARSETRMPS